MAEAARKVERDRDPWLSEPFLDPTTGFCGWTTTLPRQKQLATPAIGGGRVLVGAGFATFEFYAFDSMTGRPLWARRTRDDGPTAAVLIDGYVVFNTESCTICVLDAATGDTVWERWLGDPLLAQPAASDGRVFMAYPSLDGHRLAAFDLETGRPLWEVGLPTDVITAPVVAGDRVYASTYDGKVSCFGVAGGRLHWCRSMRATSAPWIWRDEVFVAHREDEPARGRRARESVWRTRGGFAIRAKDPRRAQYLESKRLTPRYAVDHQIDASVGFGTPPPAARLDAVEDLTGEATVHGAWRYQGSRPCVWDDHLYTTTGDILSATHLATGTERWTWSCPGAPEGDRALSPPAVANGRVYAGTHDGRVLSWDALSGELRWSVLVGDGAVWQPAVSRGQVYAGLAGGRLVCFATGDPRDDGWEMWGGGPGHNGHDA